MLLWFLLPTVLFPAPGSAQSLRGSVRSLDWQNREARRHDFTYLQNPPQVQRFVRAGLLVPLKTADDYVLSDVSFPVARPAVSLFITRLSAQYRRACGESLVVTSLTRPLSHQPRNASSRSVHPTGMALDLRRPRHGPCRRWLERTLLQLERRRVLDVTLERRPPHYHVAVAPTTYLNYVARLTGESTSRRVSGATSTERYTVSAGDSLWSIGRRFCLAWSHIREVNGLTSTRIYPGQTLSVPATSSCAS